ncbi:MAG: hypothetical protein O2798_06940 [Chloroflexi bacterium]|nr:hypothetical protein [Chloroflexota bacterium]MDA1240562.1 hypothetical protein [Chloroflexota bacterium]MQC47847.1 hypothetical protein [Chloroflexota bacterium]
MRFKRADLPGLLIATLAPVGLFMILVASYDLWRHHGTPLLGFLSVNIAVGGGIIGAFSRFIRNWELALGSLVALLAMAGGVLILQWTGNDGTAFATALKFGGLLAFGLLNVAIIQQLLVNGLNPILVRREARAAREAQG